MRPDLASAVYSCIDAAGREWDVVWQRKLLGVSCLIYTRFDPLASLLIPGNSGS
jgi:hypothetical protein